GRWLLCEPRRFVGAQIGATFWDRLVIACQKAVRTSQPEMISEADRKRGPHQGSSPPHVSATEAGAVKAPTIQRSLGLDIANSVFQLHSVDLAGQVVIRKASLRLGILPEAAAVPGRYR